MATDYDWHPAPQSGSVFKVETRNLGWWVLLAILISVVIHVLLYLVLGMIDRANLEPREDGIVFRTRRDQPTIDREKLNELLADPVIPEDRPEIKPEKLSELDLVDETLDEFDIMEQAKEETIRMAPVDSPQIFSREAPKVPSEALDVAARSLNLSAGDVLNKDLEDMKNQLIESSAQTSNSQPIMELSRDEGLTEGVDTDEFFKDAANKAFGNEADEFIKGYSSLDSLIGRTGGIPAGTEEKIALPTDILFEYNEFELKEEARLSMMKLAFLVQTNPDAKFIIEGHTDSFGGAEFNKELSLKRARAVRDWLVERLRIDTNNIEIVGIGKDRPIVSTEGTADEQALNRRVEIVVKSPDKPGDPEPAPVSQPEPGSGTEPKPHAEMPAQPKAEPIAKPKAEPLAQPKPKAEPVAQPKPKAEPIAVPRPQAKPVE